MFRRILFTTTAAATLLAAAPAFAAEHADAKTQPCSCCSDGSIHDVDHPMREGQKQKAASERKSAPAASDELNSLNRAESWGG